MRSSAVLWKAADMPLRREGIGDRSTTRSHQFRDALELGRAYRKAGEPEKARAEFAASEALNKEKERK